MVNLPVSTTATGLIMMSLKARPDTIDAVKELSAVDIIAGHFDLDGLSK